jgi:Ca2+/Na+ antiporter
MERFKLNPSEYTLLLRIRRELALLLLLLAILLFFVGLNVVYFTATILMYILLLLLKRNRIITSLQFNDEAQTLEFEYYYLIFFHGKEDIPYSKLNFKMSLKRFGFGAATQTLEIFKGKVLNGEIRKEGKWKWDENHINSIYEKLTSIQSK